jgi:hypothetical protein
MQTDPHSDDVQSIEALIARQFASLDWTPGVAADWTTFANDFFPGASLYPSARPAKRQSVEAFIERMKSSLQQICTRSTKLFSGPRSGCSAM